MKRVYQTRFGKEGNCWPAVLASMLELTIEETDHCSANFHGDEQWLRNTEELLADHGLFHVEIDRRPDGSWPCTRLPEGAIVIIGLRKDHPKKLPHVVIARARLIQLPEGSGLGFEVIHDPLSQDRHLQPYEGAEVDSIFVLGRLETTFD